MSTPDAPKYSGIVSGSDLEFVGYMDGDNFLGRLQRCSNVDPTQVYQWWLPSTFIETTVYDGRETTRIPVGSVDMLAGSLGANSVKTLDPSFAVRASWYASGFYDASSRTRARLGGSILSLLIQPDGVTLEK